MDENGNKTFTKSFGECLARIQEHEVSTCTKYVAIKSSKGFNDEKVSPTDDQRIYWQGDTPYFIFSSKVLHCHQGKDKHANDKKKYLEEKDRKALEDHSFVKRYRQTQVTKKLNCPASIRVTRVIMMPEHKLSGSLSRHYEKVQAHKIIKGKIERGEKLGEEGYLFNLPGIDEHQNHFLGDDAGNTEPVDSRVRKHIEELVRKGERNAVVIAKLTKSYVETTLKENDRSRRRFYPNLATIRSIISCSKLKSKKSSIDQENLMIFVKSLKQNEVYFRPYTQQNDEEKDENELTKRNLLFVYQNTNMRRMYKRYGQNAVLLDATYRTCKYALPLYFLVVNTNVNYQVVGVIITQFETKEDIAEGLSIIKNWSPEVNPKYAMTDFAYEEISSLEEVFPGIKTFICSFHREQAWNRWLSKGNNVSVPRNEALAMFRKIANSPNEEEAMTAIEELRRKEFFDRTPLKTYFEGTWLKEIKRWASAYKPDDFHINTNNGVERLNKELKYGYLEGFKGCSLTELIKVVVEEFLPERYKVYLEANSKMSTKHRSYGNNIPKYLNERPKWFVKLVMKKTEAIPSTVSEGILQTNDFSFTVKSFTNKEKMYHVNFEGNRCKCTCQDYAKERIICKHILCIGLKYPEWKMENIHLQFFSEPIFLLDSDLCKNKHIDVELEDSETQSLDNTVEPHSKFENLPTRGSSKRHALNDFNATLRSLQSISHYLGEEELKSANATLKALFSDLSSKVDCDNESGLPKEIQEPHVKKDYGKLALRQKKGPSGRVGVKADISNKSSKLNIEIANRPTNFGQVQCSLCLKNEFSKSVPQNKKIKSVCKLCLKID